MKELFHTFLYEPIYNALVFLVGVLPWEDVGLAIILLTLLVKFILFPLAHKASKMQKKMRDIEPELKTIKENHKDNRQKQAELMMELYKKHGINPFGSFLTLFIQIPIIFALYFVFLKGLTFDTTTLYPFISPPQNANFNFLGYIDLHQKSVILALLAAITQYFQINLSMAALPPPKKEGEMTFQEEFVRNMSLQMRYLLPIMVLFISYTLSSAIALYWATSNIFSITHEIYVKQKVPHLDLEKEANPSVH